MNPELLLAHFDRINDAPNAVPRLRRFIFDLAIRGRLVPQDQSDEPASVLLKRIVADKTTLGKGTTKKPHLARSLSTLDFPFLLPSGWAASTLQSVCLSVTDGDHLPPPKVNQGIPFLVIGNVRGRTMNFDNCRHVSEEYYEALDSIRRPQKGDILYTLVGSYGIPILITDNRPFCVQRHIGILRPSLTVSSRFLCYALESKWVFDQATAIATGIAQKTVPLAGLRNLLLPFPPFAEQLRIVNKIEELMALCDQLEKAQTERENHRQRLAIASLRRLKTGAGSESIKEQAQFYLRHLSRLTSNHEQIKLLRQTVINLAVSGKLVPQDPTDEPASELLKRIDSNTRCSHTALGVASLDTVPFPIPLGWQWIHFGQIIKGADAGWSPKSEDFPRSGEKWGVLKVSAVSWDEFRPEENKQLLPGVIPPERARVRCGDFLISRANTSELVAKCVVVKKEPTNLILSDKIVRLQIAEQCSKEFLCMVNNHAVHARSYYADEASGTSVSMKNVSRASIYALPVPLPPTAEQCRIVAKVNGLMSLCDRLEEQLSTARVNGRRLLEAVLNQTLTEDRTVSDQVEALYG